MIQKMCVKCFIVTSLFQSIFTGKAQEKCQEYGKLVYQSELSPTLQAVSSKNSVSKCALVEAPLIVAGTKALKSEFPHMALVGYGTPVIGWYCGGAVISETTILTAAHCLSIDEAPATTIRVGMLNHSDTSTIQEINILKSIKHPDYSANSKYNDIALLELSKPIKFNEFVRPACLNTDPDLMWDKAIVIGFGKTEFDGPMSDHLMKVMLNSYVKEDCVAAYQDNKAMIDGLLDSQFCAGEIAGGKDSCQGDSGGPIQIVVKEPYCMYNIIGIVSFGKLCGFANSPGIYTKVASFISWIEENTWK